jgi:hypothetical protein
VTGAVFLSASVPDPKRAPQYAQTADVVAITSAVSALVHVVLGRRLLVWGGHPAITPMVWMVAQDMGVNYGEWVTLYQSSFFEDQFPEDNDRFQNVVHTDKRSTLEESLRLMRERMFSEHRFEAAVFIGGMKGIVDEFALFRRYQPGARVVPILSAGGAALEIGEALGLLDTDLRLDLDYVALLHRHLQIDVRENRFEDPEKQPKYVADRLFKRP